MAVEFLPLSAQLAQRLGWRTVDALRRALARAAARDLRGVADLGVVMGARAGRRWRVWIIDRRRAP